MNSNFAKRINEYLRSECSDYDLKFSWEWVADTDCCEVTISRGNYAKELRFKYNNHTDDLKIELTENCYYNTREFDETVKYFWMLVSPAIFPLKQ